jgi:hypothetical protein
VNYSVEGETAATTLGTAVVHFRNLYRIYWPTSEYVLQDRFSYKLIIYVLSCF